MIKLEFVGKPIAKARHRSTGRRTTYNPQTEIEAAVKWEAREQCHNAPVDGAVKMSLLAIIPRPKSHFGTGKNSGKLKPSAPVYHVSTPDTDNILKFYKDALNGIAYMDDSQIMAELATKIYANDKDHQGVVRITIVKMSLLEMIDRWVDGVKDSFLH